MLIRYPLICIALSLSHSLFACPVDQPLFLARVVYKFSFIQKVFGFAAWRPGFVFFLCDFPLCRIQITFLLGVVLGLRSSIHSPTPHPLFGNLLRQGKRDLFDMPSSSLSRFLFWCVLGCCCGSSIMQKRNFPLPIPLPASVVV